MTDLIQSTMTRDHDGRLVANPNSVFCRNLMSKRQQKWRSEQFELMCWEVAVNKVGNEAALLSCISRKKCFKRGGGDKPDILWPKVQVGRDTTWSQEENYDNVKAINDDTFNAVATDFQQIADNDFDDLQNFSVEHQPQAILVVRQAVLVVSSVRCLLFWTIPSAVCVCENASARAGVFRLRGRCTRQSPQRTF